MGTNTNTNTKLCLMRTTDFCGKINQTHYDHNVVFMSTHKDDNFLEILEMQQYIAGHFSMILNNIHVKCLPPESVWHLGHLQSTEVVIYNKYFKSMIHLIETLWKRTLNPTYIVTDDEEVANMISDHVPFFSIYPGMKLCQPKLSRTIEALCLDKPIDIQNGVHCLHLAGFNKKRGLRKFPIKSFLRDIPEQYILYFAVGTYRKEYNYQHVIGALYTLMKYAKHRVNHKVFVVLGGNYNDTNIQDEQYYHMLLSSVRSDLERFNILFLDRISLTDKKALFRRSNAMIYLNSKPGYNPDLRLSLSVGCPIISLKAGYAEHVTIHGYSGFHLEKCEPIKLAVYMYRLMHPLKKEYHSECAREHYLKEHTLTLYTLDSFRQADTPRPVEQPPKKERKDTKGRNKSKITQVVIDEPQVPVEQKVNIGIDPNKLVLLYKSLSTNTLYPEMDKKTIEKRPSLPNIKIEEKKPKEKAKAKVKAKSTSKPPQQTKPEKAKPTKPKHRIVEQMDVTPRTRLLMKSKSTSKLSTMSKVPSKPPPAARPAAKVYKRKPEPPSMVRAVGAFALKRDVPTEEPPKADTSKEEHLKAAPSKKEQSRVGTSKKEQSKNENPKAGTSKD